MRDYDEPWAYEEPMSLPVEIAVIAVCLGLLGAWIWVVVGMVSWAVRAALS